MAFVPATPALKAGDKLPPLVVEGWLNGMPPTLGTTGMRILVVDLWANWCPLCRQGAPDLVGLFKKYADRGVAFVSLTNMPQDAVARFVDEFHIAWPNGYGAGPDAVAALGAGTGMGMPGYGVAPALYLVGPDVRIMWSDDRARYRHVESAKWHKDIEQAIEAALAKPPAPAK
jgi:thiol-disulfide isomerase/thioredoxin